MKQYALGMGLALLLAISSLPASADCGSMTTEHHLRTSTGFTLGPGDIVRLAEPLMLTGTVHNINTGLIHLDLADGSDVIVPTSLAFFRDGNIISSSILDEGSSVSVEIPGDYNWVMGLGSNAPFASVFGDNEVVVLGGYGGPVWISPAALAAANLELVTSASFDTDEAATLHLNSDGDLEADVDVDVELR